MQDTRSTTSLRDHLQSKRALALLDHVRLDEIVEFFGPADGAQVTIHVYVLDRKLVLELERALELNRKFEKE